MRFFVRLIFTGALAWLGWWLFKEARAQSQIENADASKTIILFVGIILTATIAGLLVALTLVPMIGDFAGSFFFTPGGRLIEKNPHSEAVAKLAQGDALGAVAAYRAVFARDPSDTLALSEAARICCEKLGDAETAASILEEALARDWPQDQAAFIANRLVDVYWNFLADAQRARAMLTQIIDSMPGTRHAANARHRLEEIESALARGELPSPPLALDDEENEENP